MPDKKTVYLMDASAFIHRSFHALGSLSTRDGRPTGAVFGFVNSLLKLEREKKPEYLGIAYDGKSSADARKKIYPQYKANRPPMDESLAGQLPFVYRVVEAFGFRTLSQDFREADDLIAAYALKFKNEGHRVVIVSGDKDFYQLLSADVSMYDPDSSKKSALTLEAFKERFLGLEPQDFLEMQALMGDSSDNIPGVPKIGEKTALKLIAEFRTLEGLYAKAETLKSEPIRKSLLENRENAFLSRELARLGGGVDTPLTLSDFKPKEADKKTLHGIFLDLQFARLAEDFKGDAGTEKAAGLGLGGFSGEGSFGKGEKAKVDRDRYVAVQDEKAWELLEEALRRTDKVALDVETDGLVPFTSGVAGISLATGENEAFYIPVAHARLPEGGNQDLPTALSRLGRRLADGKKELYGQNAKFDWLILSRHGLKLPAPAGDPMIASYLLDPDKERNLDALSLRHLDHKTISFKDVVPDKKGSFKNVPLKEATRYSGEDADLALRLSLLLDRELEKDGALHRLYRRVELPLEKLLVEMEESGVRVDAGALKEISKDLEGKLKSVAEKIYDRAGTVFNIASPKQVGEVLFERMNLPSGKKTTKTKSYSTDNEVLSELASVDPIAQLLLDYRELSKLKSTYADKLPLAVNPNTGRIHTSFKQTQAVTGRLASADPNLQNIPAKTEEGRRIREAFLAREGAVLISADYSQIELRVMAEFSQDKALIQAFLNDEDVHSETAARVFGLKPGEVDPESRRKAKAINFGIIFGQGPFGLAKALKISQAEARDFIDLYFSRFPGVKSFMEEIKKEAKRAQMVRTLFGRRRFLPNISSKNYQLRAEAERMAVNTPIQGTAADLIKIAMLRVDERLKRENLDARILLQVHDELIVEAAEDQGPKAEKVLAEEMALGDLQKTFPNVKPFKVPLKVDTSVSRRWSHA
ncbi:MAG: DNA polymerase I [Deltaproteobacteria bacterium]|jgi:DNA polymerase-1|nr:DNA polymerase I [Deltaproteobacteria bacterium]